MRRHDFDLLSFLFGIGFLAAGLIFLGGVPGGPSGAVPGGLSVAWAGPAAAIGLGILLVVAAWPRRPAPSDPDPLDEAHTPDV